MEFNLMVHYINKFKKEQAIKLRKKGLSYSEIRQDVPVPKSTLTQWLKRIRLTETQRERIKNRQLEVIKKASHTRILKTKEKIEEIKKSSQKDVKEISKRELWLMGIILYWKERMTSDKDDDLRKGVRFMSSDPYLIKFFLKWLKEVGGLGKSEIDFDIFISENRKNEIDEVVKHWSKITGYSREDFKHFYYQKNTLTRLNSSTKRRKRSIAKSSLFGLLRIRVKSSSMLARQIAGWIKGIQNLSKD